MTSELTPLASAIGYGQREDMSILLSVVVFLSAMVIDFAEASYIEAVHARAAQRAAVWSLIMYAVGALGFVAVIDVSLWLMIPEGLGFYCGTLLALQRKRSMAS